MIYRFLINTLSLILICIAISGFSFASSWLQIDTSDGSRLFLNRTGYEITRDVFLEYMLFLKVHGNDIDLPKDIIMFSSNIDYVLFEHNKVYARTSGGSSATLDCPDELEDLISTVQSYAEVIVTPESRGWKVWRRYHKEETEVNCIIIPNDNRGGWAEPIEGTMKLKAENHYLFVTAGTAPTGGKVCFKIKRTTDLNLWWDNNEGRDYPLP